MLPETVVSRCQRLELPPLSATEVASALAERGIETEKAGLLAGLSHGCPGWALSAAADASLLQQRDEDMATMLRVVAADCVERFAFANQLASRFSQNRASVYDVLDLWLDFWRDVMLVKLGCDDIITNVDLKSKLAGMAAGYHLSQIEAFVKRIPEAADQLRRNANPRLALEVLMIDIPIKEGEEDLTPQLK